AFVTSGSWPIGAGRRCCRCASLSLGRRATRAPSTAPRRKTRHGRYGFVHTAAAPWPSWSDSRPPKRGSALRQGKANYDDLLFVISNLFRVGTPAREDRPHPVPSHSHASRKSSHTPLCPPDASFIAYFGVSRHDSHHSKHIAPQYQTGSLQVALSATL